MVKKTSTPPPPQPPDGVVPDPADSHPVMRASKWVGALVGIVGGLAVLVTGIWKVGDLLNDLESVQSDLTALRAATDTAAEAAQHRSEVQEEILLNLRIAVASLQARSSTPVGGGTPSRPSTGTHRPTAARPRVPHPAFALAPTSPEVVELVASLPPLPPPAPAPPTISLATPPTSETIAIVSPEMRLIESLEISDYDHSVETADVALERAEILQDQL